MRTGPLPGQSKFLWRLWKLEELSLLLRYKHPWVPYKWVGIYWKGKTKWLKRILGRSVFLEESNGNLARAGIRFDRYWLYTPLIALPSLESVPLRQQFEDALLTEFIECIAFRIYAHPKCLAGKGDVVLDLGASVGGFSLEVGKSCGTEGRIYAFEPVPQTFEALVFNVSRNQERNISCRNLAVGDTNGEVMLDTSSWYLDSRLVASHSHSSMRGRSCKSTMTTIDQFVASEGISKVDLIKLDIEGAEEMALAGASETLRKWHPRLSIASYHNDVCSGEPQHKRIIHFLESFNYRIRTLGDWHIYAY